MYPLYFFIAARWTIVSTESLLTRQFVSVATNPLQSVSQTAATMPDKMKIPPAIGISSDTIKLESSVPPMPSPVPPVARLDMKNIPLLTAASLNEVCFHFSSSLFRSFLSVIFENPVANLIRCNVKKCKCTGQSFAMRMFMYFGNI